MKFQARYGSEVSSFKFLIYSIDSHFNISSTFAASYACESGILKIISMSSVVIAVVILFRPKMKPESLSFE